MNNKKIRNVNNEVVNIEVIRYFLNNDNEYLIYSLNEIDEAGYTKLYASKIVGSMARIITDNDEWLIIKEIIKDVVKNNRDGSDLNLIDLDEEDLSDIILQDNRVFKLQGNLVNLLSENKKMKKSIPTEKKIEEEVPYLEEEVTDYEDGFETDYESLYHAEATKNELLNKRVIELEDEISKLKDIVNQVKDLLS